MTIDGYPDPGVRCSELTLTVSIVYDRPFTAPDEWDHDHMLRQLVGETPLDRFDIEGYDINCTSHVEWVELKPITYSPGFDKSPVTTTQVDEANYRDHCRRGNHSPTQAGFWGYILRTACGVHQIFQ